MADKLKVLVMASTFPRWGNDTEPDFVYELTRRLTDAFEVFVLCPFAQGAKEYEEIGSMRIYRYKYLPFGWGTLAYEGGIIPKLRKNKLFYFQVPFFVLFQFLSMRKIVKKNNIDLIHAHWVIPQGLLAAWHKRFSGRNVKLLTTVHGGDIFGFNGAAGRWLKKTAFRHADAITVVSNAIKKTVKEKYVKNNLFVYPMGVDTGHFNPDKKSDQLRKKLDIKENFLLFAGRLAEKKGVRYLLEALPEVLSEYPDTKLVIVGDGVLKADLRKMTEDLRLGDKVFFAGSMAHKDLAEYFATADLVVVPSISAKGGDSEGFGLVVAEAMSSGTLVITTDLPAIRDIVENNGTGFIVQQKNAAALSAAIISTLRNKSALNDMRSRARQSVIRKFDWEVVAGNYRRLVREMGRIAK